MKYLIVILLALVSCGDKTIKGNEVKKNETYQESRDYYGRLWFTLESGKVRCSGVVGSTIVNCQWQFDGSEN